ncbi:tuberin, putative [Entamoeba invadens IP1]|uniref:Tuberin, putative n=1 Tax=Entamoeba invadens IP1 TaxID=370355 RepID=A0A0A1UG72_ENTIV|nr:tuberin, putative [Entamoeba invadens IP1]ELP94482.1 tuberin, putative [Entamoeba invadens IP1]|eukprot:XP_004261253.1 tuberin, putative [Entamoeba invadens IP1]
MTELDKKIRKKQAQIFDQKENAVSQVKACISLSELQSPEDYASFLKANKQGISGFIIEVTQYYLNHVKKGRVNVPVKEALNLIKLIKTVTPLYEFNELSVFDLYQKFLINFLKIESHPEIREASCNLLIDLALFYGEQDEITFQFINTVNLGALYIKADFPVNKLSYAEYAYVPPEEDTIDQPAVTTKLISNLIKTIKTPPNIDHVFHLVEVLLSYVFPVFADNAHYVYKQQHPTCGVKGAVTPKNVDQLVLDFYKELVTSPSYEKLRNRPAHILFIKHFYLNVLQLPPDETTKGIITSTISYFFDIAIQHPFKSPKLDELIGLKNFLIEDIAIFFDAPCACGKINEVKELVEIIKLEFIKLSNIELTEELKTVCITVVLKSIDLLVKNNFPQSTSSFVDLILVLFVKWERSPDDWIMLRERMTPYFSNTNVTDQIKLKLNHCTRLVLKDFYSPLLLENTDEITVGTKKVERSTHLEVPTAIFVAPSLDDKFSNFFPHLAGEDALQLWYYFYSLFQDVNTHPDDQCFECGIKILYEFFLIFVNAETKVDSFGTEINPTRPKLVDVFGNIFFGALKRKTQTPIAMELCYRAICKLVNRPYVRFTDDLYDLFYDTVLSGLNSYGLILLEELYDIFPNQVPGWPALIYPFVRQLLNLKLVKNQKSENPNRDIQIVSLLNSMVPLQEDYPKVFVMLSQSEKLNSSFTQSLTECYRNLMANLSGISVNIALIYGLATHAIYARRADPKNVLSPIVKVISKFIREPNEELYRPAAEVIGELVSFSQYFTVEDVRAIFEELLNVINDKATKSEAIACAFTSMIDWAFAPSCIFSKALTADLTVRVLNAISYAMALPKSQQPTDPNVKYRASAPECAEVFLQTILNAFGYVPNDKGSDKFFSTHMEEGEITWWAFGNTLLSIEKGTDGDFCNLTVRNAVGKTLWGVRANYLLEELGIVKEKPKGVLRVKDISKRVEMKYPDVVVQEKKKNELKSLMDDLEKEDAEMLDWGMPNGVNRTDFQNDLKHVKEAMDNVEMQAKKLGVVSALTSRYLIEDNSEEIDPSKFLIHALLCQTQFIDPMPLTKTLLVPINPNEKFKILLGNLDKSCVRPFHKVGLIYVKKGQSDQFDILMNETGSKEYVEFCNGMGWTLDIKSHNGFLGGLDKGYLSTGEIIRYYADSTKEVIFHDVVLIPTQKDDSQQLTKKRHVGNDYVHIVWNESGEYSPHTITSQFNAAHIVITPLGNGLHKIRIWRKQNVRQFGPLMDGMIVGKELLPALVRETAVNANYCCSLNISSDDYLKPYLRRTTLIKEIVEKNDCFPVPTFFNTLSVVTNPQSLTNFAIKK